MITVHMVCGKWKKSSIIVILFLMCIVCTGCFHQDKGAETAVALEDYFRGDFSVTGEPVLNQEVEIVFTVNPVLEAPHTEIRFYLPEGIELVQGDLTWKGDIKKDELVQVKITVKPIQEGQWMIWSYVESVFSSKRKEHYTYYLVFLTSKESGQVSRTWFYPPSPEGEAKLMMINMILDAPPDPRVGEEIVLTFSLIASKDLSTVRAVVVLPEEFTLVNGSLEWTGDLKEAEIIEVIRITIIPTERGRFWFTGAAVYDTESLKYGFQIYIR
jgi:hypothetical protein